MSLLCAQAGSLGVHPSLVEGRKVLTSHASHSRASYSRASHQQELGARTETRPLVLGAPTLSCRSSGLATSARRRPMSVLASVSDAKKASEPLKVIISGAPASGKGTQCEEIVNQFGLVHISAGDLLRAEVKEGTENGKLAQSYMDAGKLVPDSVVNKIVKDRLLRPDAEERGWLLDGYPRSKSQADALISDGIVPDVFILLNVPDEIIVTRVVGRRMDPVTGKIYHLTFSPPPDDQEVLGRLVQRSDDNEEKIKARLDTHAENVNNVLSLYQDKLREVDGDRPKSVVFEEICDILASVQEQKAISGSSKRQQEAGLGVSATWLGMPTRLNDIPHSREIRQYFYKDVCIAAKSAVKNGLKRFKVELLIPELNPEMDVYRIGTLMELMRELAFSFAAQGSRVKVCVQGAMGKGIFRGMPLQLAGTRRILDAMDWGEDEDSSSSAAGLSSLITTGAVGAQEVAEEDDIFLVMAPQNTVGNCILEDLEAMCDAAGHRPVILINPRLRDVPSASGVMQVQGRAERSAFTASFQPCYTLRLLFFSGTFYPILGAVRMAYPGRYEVYKRVDTDLGKEEYQLCDTLPAYPTSSQISSAFSGKKGSPQQNSAEQKGFWGFLASILS